MHIRPKRTESAPFSVSQPMLVAVLAISALMMWPARLEQDRPRAQSRTPIVATRIFTGPDGQTHAEQVTVKLGSGQAGAELSEMIDVAGLQFRRTPPNYFVDWHPAPRRQYVVTLSGRGEIELTGGQKIPIGPGHILFAEDVTGKGHITRGVGSEDRISLFIPLVDRRTAATDEQDVRFLDEANAKLLALAIDSARAGWVQQTHITVDTELLAAKADEAFTNASTRYAREAARFDKASLTPDLQRQVTVLKTSLTLAAPDDPKKAEEVTRITSAMQSAYGKGKYCKSGESDCLDIQGVEKVLRESRDPARLREVWEGWHLVGAPMRKDYARFVELSNEGARHLGFADTGAMWRSRYDMPPDAVARELDRLWDQLRPLYVSLHAYVRAKLHEKYGATVPPSGPIPAHLTGNLWAQDWSHIIDIVAPSKDSRGFSLTEILQKRKTSPTDMVKYGERFFLSLGFDPLPKTFWERSLFVKPRDREVVCHASAWDIDFEEDVRIKMCIEPREEDFTVIHHELGHNFYQRAYRHLPFVLRDAANDGFHEALGDVLALSVTPEYLVKIGLLDRAPDTASDTGLLLARALEKLAFLPFGLLVDQWRWQVFAGQIPEAGYNRAWWDLKLKYQGVAPPSARGEQFFDPGAKYHVPANTPYTRYFLASILQFQFHRALAKAAGCAQPLHRCSIYGSKEAGARLKRMMEMGQSKPWPDALESVTGQRDMDATAMVDYFAPLKKWLDEQNKGKPIGW